MLISNNALTQISTNINIDVIQDLDEKEVHEKVPENCLLDIVVQLTIPIYTSSPVAAARVSSIDFDLKKEDFRSKIKTKYHILYQKKFKLIT